MPESSLKIKLLNDSLINKIAAGEVIERPASVVKELLENSIDASATNILVELKDGGREFIRIADDGEGMLPGDARLCIARHATSKISHESELFSIKTLGFRGEALASIAAVSRMTIETMRNDSESGIKIDVVCGQIKEEKPIAKNHGTTITVTDLFYNLPVRKKFLKSESSELSKIIDTISQLGMAYPYISFKLFHNNRETLNFPKSQGYKDRIGALLGPKIIHHLIPFSYENEIMSVTGFAGDRETSRSDRRNQYLFVNDRPVFNNSVNFAIKSSYQGYIPESRFPVIVLFIKINFDEVDVNIHPAKRDVRFRNDSKMISVIQSVIKNALHNFNTMPSISMISQQSQEFAYEKYQMPAPDYVSEAAQQNLFPTSSDSSGKEVHENLPLVNYLQLHNTYILCQIKNGLLFIDQHVAHERILFEKAAKDLERPSGASQQLLFPINIDLIHREKAILLSNSQRFELLGFSIKFFSGNTIVVDAVPSPFVKTPETEKVIRDMLYYLMENEKAELKEDEKFAKSYACGAAIKAGQPLSQEEMNALVDMLFQCKNPYTCPHGRPVLVRLSMDEISKKFFR